MECIDQWLRLNVKCPRCRCSVFPNLDLSAISNLRADSDQERPSPTVVTATQYVRSQTPSQSYRVRLQGLLRPIRTENAGYGNESENALEVAENGGLLLNPGPARANPGPDRVNPGPARVNPSPYLVEHDVAALSSAPHH